MGTANGGLGIRTHQRREGDGGEIHVKAWDRNWGVFVYIGRARVRVRLVRDRGASHGGRARAPKGGTRECVRGPPSGDPWETANGGVGKLTQAMMGMRLL